MQNRRFLGVPVGLVGVAHVALLLPIMWFHIELQERGSIWAWPMMVAFWLCWGLTLAYMLTMSSKADRSEKQLSEAQERISSMGLQNRYMLERLHPESRAHVDSGGDLLEEAAEELRRLDQ